MWITQSYLGTADPEASVFVYYMFEDYVGEQNEFTREVQRRLEDLGDLYGGKVSLLMPNPRYAIQIESEVRDKVEGLWWSLAGKLPGLLFTTYPLNEFDGTTGEYCFLQFKGRDEEAAIQVFKRLRQLIDEQISWDHRPPEPVEPESLFARVFRALELKPGAAGFSIDLKDLGRRRQ